MDKTECLLERYGADATIPIEAGEGWTLYINWVRAISGNHQKIAENEPCPIEAWVKKIKGYKRSESPLATHNQLDCKNCMKTIDVAMYRSDAISG